MNKTRVAFIQREWEDNLGVLWISAVLRQHGFDTRVWVEERNTYAELAHFDPGLIGYSCITGAQGWVVASIEKVRAVGIGAMVVVGGPHPTFYPGMIEDERIDAICRGEGEHAMLGLAQAMEDSREPFDIKNLWFNLRGEIRKNDVQPLIQDLDSIPFPDRSYYERYPFLATNPYRIFITSRGCPFQCTFCFNHVLHGLYGNTARYVRRRSVTKVIEEIVQVRSRWGIDQIRFSDDHFALDRAWLREFSSVYKNEICRPYSVNARADVLDEERISLLAESGCRLVCFGVETGSEDARNRVLKKKITDQQIVDAARMLKRHGIAFLTSNIIGLPGETVDEAWQTVEINQKIRTDLPWFSMMQYYPGTVIHKEAEQAGLLPSGGGFENVGSYFENSYLKQENIGELQNIHSFSIIVSRFRFLEPLAKWLAKRFPPNAVFKAIFKVSYIMLTIKRADFKLSRLIRAVRYYRGSRPRSR